MNTRAFTLALGIAAMAMYMVYTYIEGQESKIVEQYGAKKPVVVAKQNIKELELIDESKIIMKNIPRDFVLPGSFTSKKDLENTMATVPILKGEQITKPRITYPGVKTGLSRQITIGKRAISVRITERQAVGRLIKPGDRVDIIAAIDYAAGQKDKQKAKTILQDVLVLSTGRNISNAIPMIGVKTPRVIRAMKLNTYTTYNTLTLELDPYQAQKLIFLLTHANAIPYFTLRNNADKKVIKRIKSTKIFDILGDEAQEAKEFFKEKEEARKRRMRGSK